MLRRVLLDDDVLLDILVDREPFVEDSVQIWKLIESKNIEGYVTPTTLYKIFDFARDKGEFEIGWQAITEIQSIMKVCIIDNKILEIANSYHLNDFEQSIQLACAKSLRLDYIITRKIEYIKSFIRKLPDSFEEIFSVVKPKSFLLILFPSCVNQNHLEFYKLRFEHNIQRMEIITLMNNSSKYILDSITTQSLGIQNQIDSEKKIVGLKRDIAIIVRYILCAILAENLNLDDNSINSCLIECKSLTISRQALIIALQHTKELTIKLIITQIANQYPDFSDSNYNIFVNELSRCFEQFIIKI